MTNPNDSQITCSMHHSEQADGIHLSAEDPLGLSSHARVVVVVAAGRNDPPQVHVPGATYVHEPCDSRGGKIGNPHPQHPAPIARQCRRITTVDRIVGSEDTPMALEGIYVEDPDVEEAGSGAQIDVEVEAQHGSLGFSTGTTAPPGILFLRGTDPDRTGHQLAMRGGLHLINSALALLTYSPDPDWSGFDEVVISVDDRGFTGSGGPGKDARGIPVEIRPIDDAPLLLVSTSGVTGVGMTEPAAPLEMLEDGRISLYNVTLYDADVNPRQLHSQILGISSGTSYDEYPVGVGGQQFQVTVNVGNGRVFFPKTAGLAFEIAAAPANETSVEGKTMVSLTQGARFSAVSADNSTLARKSMVDPGAPAVPWWREARFTGRLEDCNRALEAMTYWPDINWNGVDVVHIDVEESRADGAAADAEAESLSPPLAAATTMYVRVAAVNDPPVVTPPSPRFHAMLRTGDLLSPSARYGKREFVTEDAELSLPGFVIRDVDLAEAGSELAVVTVTITALHGTVSLTWHGARAGVGPGDSRHPWESNSLGPDLTGLLFRDDITGDWAPWSANSLSAARTITFSSPLSEANAALQSLTFTPDKNFYGTGALVQVEAFDRGLSGSATDPVQGLGSQLADIDTGTSTRGIATVPISVLPVNDAPTILLPFADGGHDVVQLDEEEERRLTGAEWRRSFVAAVEASAYLPLRTGIELWRSQGVFPGKDAGSWGKTSEMQWKETLVADLNEGVGDASPRHFAVWEGSLYFQVRLELRWLLGQCFTGLALVFSPASEYIYRLASSMFDVFSSYKTLVWSAHQSYPGWE